MQILVSEIPNIISEEYGLGKFTRNIQEIDIRFWRIQLHHHRTRAQSRTSKDMGLCSFRGEAGDKGAVHPVQTEKGDQG